MSETDAQPVWRVSVDTSRCIGSGSCAGISSRHFRLDGAVAEPLAELVAAADDVVAAADMCPAEAITIHDLTTGQLVTGTG